MKALKQLYPQLVVKNFTGLTAFFLPGETESVIDVIFPHQSDLVETLANATWIENKEFRLVYRIPSLEEAMANKYGAMLNLSRGFNRRVLDSVDFAEMVLHAGTKGRAAIDLDRLAVLGELVGPAAAERKFSSLWNGPRPASRFTLRPIEQEGK